MLINPPTKFRKRRTPRNRSESAQPELPPMIVSVAFGEESDRMVVQLTQPVVSIDSLASAFEVFTTGWVAPISMNNEDPLNVVFMFPVEVDTATQWRVLNPPVWHFADEEALSEPYEGTIP